MRSRSPIRILFVDDESLVRRVVVDVLANAGYPVEIANSAGPVITADWPKFDLLIVDYNMPGSDGLTLVEHARAAGFAGEVILFVAGLGADEQLRAAQMGVRDIIIKSSGTALLLEKVRAAHAEIERRRNR